MKIYIVIFCILITASCSFYSGPGERAYVNVKKASSFNGLYLNRGEPRGLLSEILWGKALNDRKIFHETIQYLDITIFGNMLIARGVTDSCIIYQEKYIYGKDFSLNDGNIILDTRFSLLSRGGDDVFVGPSYQKLTLCLDTDGNGIYKNQSYGVGLVFLIIPVAFSDSQEIRFKRIKSIDSLNYCQ
ncbi:MAG: hypothetical protein H6627_14810 [Calditrichae bacterium]|nr:hypothetical protein [Calditrichota bacterium]MCB9059835.1 hypothetical protein [Calditrichia bacterium]